MKDKHPIDDLFRENLASHKMTPPPAAWDAIEGNISSNGKRKPIYLFSAIAASVCIICASALTFISHNDNPVVNRSEGIIHTVEKSMISKLSSQPDGNFQINLSGKQSTEIQQQKITVIQAEINTPETSSFNEKIEFSTDIHTMKRELIVSSGITNDLILKQPQFTLPSYEISILKEAPSGRRSRFLQSVVSMAKGVQNGQKTLSGLRKSKIEFIQDDLKYGSEKESEDEATIDQDPPSYQK